MINRVDADSNVEEILIRIDDFHRWDDEILTTMINRYSNVYDISVIDSNDLVDYKIHRMIK